MKKIIFALCFIFLNLSTNAQTTYDTSGLYESHYGKKDAPVHLSVFFSFTCFHCKKWHHEVWPLLKKNYVDKGLVHVNFIDVPIDQTSYHTSVIAHCKKGRAFEGLVESIFKNQDKYMLTGEDDDERQENALKYVQKQVALVGLKKGDIDRCMEDVALKSAVLNRLKEARNRYGFTHTPGFKLNDKVIPEYLDYKRLVKEINAKLDPKSAQKGFFGRLLSKVF